MRRRQPRHPLGPAVLLSAALAAPVTADGPSFEVRFPELGVTTRPDHAPRITVGLDADDDDENGVVDAREEQAVPEVGLRTMEPRVAPGQGPVTLEVEGGLRVLRDGAPVALPTTLRPRDLRGTLELQGTRAGPASLLLNAGGVSLRIPVTVVSAGFLDGSGAMLDATRHALGLSHRITNDATLPRRNDYRGTSPDQDNVRLEIYDQTAVGLRAEATLVSVDPATGRVRFALEHVPLHRPASTLPFRSPWIRLVGDRTDAEAPSVGDRVLRTRLRDRIEVRYRTPGGEVMQALRFGRPGDEDGKKAARRVRTRIRILRLQKGGVPIIGSDDHTALRLARDQVAIANEIWAQCFLTFGPANEADVAVVDPPPPTLVSVADGDGLPARGDGQVRFRVNDRPIGPVRTAPGAEPVSTALRVAEAVEAAGFKAVVTENPGTEFGAGRSADVLVRTARGTPVTVTPDGEHPLSTDTRQSVAIGSVDLGDGLREFDNMNAAAGTLEERTLIKALGDADPRTVDLFVVNHFTGGTRQGEAFIEGDSGAIVNVVILDRTGLKHQRAAWTQSHEIGHVLLDQPYHPDNVGPDRPWLLMDADTSLPLVTGPKRLRWEDCRRVHTMSGLSTEPALLERYDARRSPPKAPSPPFDRGY